ncbi:unnamed protein product [Schistosoma margrebowiei]|uniref:Uncharacterized protein n=1 Tax=Schistosoma margrebowiei TaxID=48269 RepID=A0A183M7D7_9TREM|nr:unnamed protein product [Schistosoma margrebowiei]
MLILTTTATININIWNVRMIKETGTTSQIATEMRRYNFTVLGISETYRIQDGQKLLDSGKMLLYSGHEEQKNPHTQTVALVLPKEAQTTLFQWESRRASSIQASFETKKEGITMNIILCYAPPIIATTTMKISSMRHFNRS